MEEITGSLSLPLLEVPRQNMREQGSGLLRANPIFRLYYLYMSIKVLQYHKHLT